jgi:hypothetical protein
LPSGEGRESGTVTAETAVLLPAVVLVLAVVLAVGSAVTGQVRCLDAAREAARLSARHEPAVRVRSTALAVAPSGADLVLRSDGSRVEALVSAPVRLLLPGRPVLVVRGRAVAAVEPWLDPSGERP